MSGAFDPPPGDAGALAGAAKALARIAEDLRTQLPRTKHGLAQGSAHWRGQRADDFAHAGQAVVDELAVMVTSTGNAANILGAYATQLRQVTADVAEYKSKSEQAVTAAAHHPAAGADRPGQADHWATLATEAKASLAVTERRAAAALAQQTSLALPKSANLSPAEIGRLVDGRLGLAGLDAGKVMLGQMPDGTAWEVLESVSGPVFTGSPKPGDRNFATWYASLTPAQQLLEAQKLATSFAGAKRTFNPFAHIKPGQLPGWAVSFNDNNQEFCPAPNVLAPKYGYFGGGTITGPGGAQWPIVMPYVRDGKYVYMDDEGAARADGGVLQLDGRDPGWHTVDSYSGVGQFGNITDTTTGATVTNILTGNGPEVQPTDPNAVTVDADGHPYAGADASELASAPPGKEWWDVTSKTMMPTRQTAVPEGTPEPELPYNEPALSASTLTVQAVQAAGAAVDLASHGQREWYVSYQVNNDGRTRALVHTYTTAPDAGTTQVVSYANAFTTGRQGTTQEVPYKTRTAGPEHHSSKVDYSNLSPQLPPAVGPGQVKTELLDK